MMLYDTKRQSQEKFKYLSASFTETVVLNQNLQTFLRISQNIALVTTTVKKKSTPDLNDKLMTGTRGVSLVKV